MCDLDQPISYSAVRLLVFQEVLAGRFPIRPLGDEGAWKASQSDSTMSCSVTEKAQQTFRETVDRIGS